MSHCGPFPPDPFRDSEGNGARPLRSSGATGGAAVPAPRASLPGAPRGGPGAIPVPVPECDLRRSPATVGPGPPSPAASWRAPLGGVSGGDSPGSAWEGKKGERECGPRRWSFAVTRRAAGRARAAAGGSGEVKQTANTALFSVDFRKKHNDDIPTQALGSGLPLGEGLCQTLAR